MKRNHRFLWIVGAVCLLGVVLAGVYFSADKGRQPLDLAAVDNSMPLAEFHGEKVYPSDVENQMRSLSATGAAGQKTADEIFMEILHNMVLYDEAVRLGYTATQSEIDAMVENSKQSYATPEGKAMMDQYCEQANLTIDEYFTSLEAQAPRTIARQKLLDAVGKQYCDEHGLTFTKVNPPAEMIQAREAYVEELFAQAEGDITYHTNGS